MMSIPVRPLQWVGGRTTKPRPSPFSSTWSATLSVLTHELGQLDARRPVMQLDVTESDLRRDGQIRANARPRSSAVRIVFDTPDGAMAFACDRFAGWQDNVRAIALGLEALRKIDRHGISTGGEQYKGYLQLGAPMGDKDAVRILADAAGMPIGEALPDLDRAWRAARNAAHPDRHGGDHSLWDEVIAAARTLRIEGV